MIGTSEVYVSMSNAEGGIDAAITAANNADTVEKILQCLRQFIQFAFVQIKDLTVSGSANPDAVRTNQSNERGFSNVFGF